MPSLTYLLPQESSIGSFLHPLRFDHFNTSKKMFPCFLSYPAPIAGKAQKAHYFFSLLQMSHLCLLIQIFISCPMKPHSSLLFPATWFSYISSVISLGKSCADTWHLLVLIHQPAKLEDVSAKLGYRHHPEKLGYYADTMGATYLTWQPQNLPLG